MTGSCEPSGRSLSVGPSARLEELGGDHDLRRSSRPRLVRELEATLKLRRQFSGWTWSRPPAFQSRNTTSLTAVEATEAQLVNVASLELLREGTRRQILPRPLSQSAIQVKFSVLISD